jgi:hypothetical protein
VTVLATAAQLSRAICDSFVSSTAAHDLIETARAYVEQQPPAAAAVCGRRWLREDSTSDEIVMWACDRQPGHPDGECWAVSNASAVRFARDRRHTNDRVWVEGAE